MPMSIRLDPALETRVNQEARRLGLTKSEFVKDALQRALGLKSPARPARGRAQWIAHGGTRALRRTYPPR